MFQHMVWILAASSPPYLFCHFKAGRRSKQKAREADRGTQTHSAANPGGEAEGMKEPVFLHHPTRRAMKSLCMSPKAHTDSVCITSLSLLF